MYRVIKFIDEDMTALVPLNWFTTPKKCLWPNFKNYGRIIKAARAHVTPETAWKEYECSELYRSDNYEMAKKWLKLSEQLSKLERDYSSSSSEDEEEARPSKRKRQIHFDSTLAEDETPALKIRIQQTNSSTVADIKPPSSTEETGQPIAISDSITLSPLQAACSSEQTSARTENRVCCCGFGVSATQFDEAIKRISGLLEALNENMQDLKQQCTLELEESSTLPEGASIPVCSMPALKNLETIISKEENFKSLVNYLFLVGGCSIKAVVSNTMKKIFSNNFAATMCWSGSVSKIEFQTLRIKDVIFHVVRKHYKCATDEEIKRAIRRWFHCASDREGGRSRRLKEAKSC